MRAPGSRCRASSESSVGATPPSLSHLLVFKVAGGGQGHRCPTAPVPSPQTKCDQITKFDEAESSLGWARQPTYHTKGQVTGRRAAWPALATGSGPGMGDGNTAPNANTGGSLNATWLDPGASGTGEFLPCSHAGTPPQLGCAPWKSSRCLLPLQASFAPGATIPLHSWPPVPGRRTEGNSAMRRRAAHPPRGPTPEVPSSINA